MIKEANVTIMVQDMDKSIPFYESLGFKLEQRWGNHYAQVKAPGITIGLHPASKANSPVSEQISIGLSIDDFTAAEELLAKNAIHATLRKEEGGMFLHFADPDGTPLYFIKPKW